MAYMKDADGRRLDSKRVVFSDETIAEAEANELRAEAAESLALSRNAVWGTTQEALAPQIVMRKSLSNPIFSTSDTTLPSIYWPSVLRVDGLLDNPLGRYYLWFSTDHGQAEARVALAYADDLEGPWTIHGPVWHYATSGTESETPSVLWDQANQRFIMYHQQANPTGAVSSQVTMVAFSANGTAWTSGGIALDVRAQTGWRGPLHTGYFRAFNIGNGFVGYGLLQGQENPTFAIWHSTDGVEWVLDARPLGYEAQYLPADRRVEWNSANIVLWRGRYLLIFHVSSFAQGAELRRTYWAAAPLTPDFRGLAGPPQKLFDADQPWESSEAGHGHAFIDDGRLVLVWRSGDGTPESEFAFGVAFADPTATELPELDYEGETVAYSLVRDPAGKFVPLGRVEQPAHWSPMFDATPPSWVTTTVGTTTVQTATSSTNPPRVRAETGATINSAARMRFSPIITLSQVEEIEFTLHGLMFSHDNGFDFRFEIGVDGQNAGVDYRQSNAEIVDGNTRGRFRTHAAGSANQNYVDRERAVYFGKPNGNGRRPQNFTLLLRPFKHEAYVLAGDQVMAAMKYDAAEVPTNVGVYCQFTLNTVVAEARAVMFAAATVKLRHN